MKGQLIAVIFGIIIVIASCSQSDSNNPTLQKQRINSEIGMGNYTIADSLINIYIASESIEDEDKMAMEFEQERMKRIRLDFNKNEAQIRTRLEEYYPDLTDSQMRKWEGDNDLEMKVIDGERMYFWNASRNLFRVNKEAKKIYQAEKKQSDNNYDFRIEYAPGFIEELQENGGTGSKDYTFKINYELEIDSGVVKAGDTIRCWLPFPRPDKNRLKNIELISTSDPNYILAPETMLHRSIYFERVATNDHPAPFVVDYQYTAIGQWFGHKLDEIKPYNTNSELYIKYTGERETHIIFTDEIKHLADSIVGDKTEPYEIVQALYTWIDSNFPWASAREYSTIVNIPSYALDNMHADCGIHTLLFATMARYKGIPAKWQSGWMLMPGEVNLHDWAEVYYEGLGWVPVDQSFGLIDSDDDNVKNFYTCGIDPYRLIVNDDYSQEFYPAKKHFRSETVDFQRGEVEVSDRNIYFNQWTYYLSIDYVE